MEYSIEGNLINCKHNFDGNEVLKKDVIKSWENNLNYDLLEKKLRKPQLGALYALKSHFTVSNNEATVVMPTGTGKTETMLSYIVSEKLEQVLIILPSVLYPFYMQPYSLLELTALPISLVIVLYQNHS